ncbi:MAG TPA: integrase core domain-containing protein [Candidatus Binatia bacterium]|jgi:transposase InsO family protein
MDQKRQFVLEWRSHAVSRAALCRLFGISRQTGYKWVRRFERALRWEDLEEHSRRPHDHPQTTRRMLVQRIIDERRRLPLWGPIPLRKRLQTKWPKIPWPAASTIGAILKREGLVVRRGRPRGMPPRTHPFATCREPNDVWCIDFKGHFAVQNGQRCYPLTVMDAATRYLLACVGFRSPDLANVRRVVEALFQTYGLPTAMRSDNGEPFACITAPAGLTQLSAWWAKLGIRLERIDPGKPQQNGRHERMHLTLKQATCSPPKRSLVRQQLAFDRFRRLYNQERPHQALHLATPASLYRPSPRLLPPRVPVPTYPFADTYLVNAAGAIRWRARTFFISNALAGECIGIYPLNHRYEEVSFAHVLRGLIDTQYPEYGLIRPKTKRNEKPTSRVSAMSPV